MAKRKTRLPEYGEQPLSRDQELWLVACAGVALATHLSHAPVWLSGAAAAVLAWRALIWWRRLVLPSRGLLLVMVLAGCAGVFMNFGMFFGRDPGTALLILFLSLKLMESCRRRDGLTVIFLGYFLQLAQFFYSQSAASAALAIATTVLLTATLIKLNHDSIDVRSDLRLATVMLAQATPFMLVLFLLFPRVQGPLWSLPSDAHGGITGLSENMSPGSIASLSLSDAIAFRAEFEGTLPRQNQLYWRGPVLTRFDGRSWHALAAASSSTVPYPARGPALRYSVTLEPHYKNWIYALELPGALPADVAITWDYRLIAKGPVTSRLRYDAQSHLLAVAGIEESAAILRQAQQLPPGFNPRARALAAQWRSETTDDEAIVRRMLDYYRQGLFFYTLQPPLLGDDSVDDFLFETRRGFCEHFASSFVFMMRAAGIPARVVTGYQGGEVNPMGGYLIVRQADAHAWAEVWLKGQGWRRIDPTAASVPSRIESGLAAAVPAGEPVPFLLRTDLAWLHSLRFQWDTLANAWNQWILGYNAVRQREVLQRLGMTSPDWQTMTTVLGVLTGALMLLLTWWTVRQRARRDPVQRAWEHLSAKLARRQLARHAWEGPTAYAQRISAAQPRLASEVAEIASLYAALRYGKGGGAPMIRALARRIADLNP